MTKTITFSDTATDVSASERENVLGAADSWHDPENDRIVVYVNYSYAESAGDAGVLTLAARMENVDIDDVQAVRDTLAAAIDSLPLDFGTVDEIKESIDIQ